MGRLPIFFMSTLNLCRLEASESHIINSAYSDKEFMMSQRQGSGYLYKRQEVGGAYLRLLI